MGTRKIVATLCLLTLFTNVLGCARSPHGSGSQILPSGEDTKAPTPPQPPEKPEAPSYPLLWERVRGDGASWSEHVLELIHNKTPSLLDGADDIEMFCPNYSKLNTPDRATFWGLLISAIVKYESNFDPTTRMHETTMGVDPITRLPVHSEGLMQLSYQDRKPYPFCDEFDWDLDQALHPEDPAKTILDPYKNLNCGVRILAHQIRKKNRIALSSGVYWAVLKLNGTYSKVPQIAALTKKMPGCID